MNRIISIFTGRQYCNSLARKMVPGLLLMLAISVSTTLPVKSQADRVTTVSGRVVDRSGDPLIGVTIAISGTATGTITDIDGNFKLNVNPVDTLQISYVGFSTQRLPVGEQIRFEIVLEEDIASLEEVVVVGYGMVKRANMVGSVANISADEVEDIPAVNLSTILEGTMPGVHIGQATGRPGASTELRIRENGTYSGSADPLYVIDGFIRDKSTFDLLDPSEIRSISILKDASAAVYGARGANGVVLVKTKMGREGRPRVNYSGSYGFSDITQMTEMLSAYEHATMMNEYWRIREPDNYETTRYTEDELDTFRNLDHLWLDRVWKPSSLTRHNLNLSGGSDKIRYFAGGSYYYETGNFKNLDVSRYALRLGLEVDLARGLTAGLNVALRSKKLQLPFYKGDDSSEPLEDTFSQLLRAPRWLPAYIGDLPVGQVEESDWWNPEALFNTSSYKRSKGSGNDVGIHLTYDMPFVQGLSARISFDRGASTSYAKQYLIPYTLYNFLTTGGNGHIITDQLNPTTPTIRVPNNERIFEDYSAGNLYQLNASLSYGRDFGQHHVDGMLVYEQSESAGEQFRAIREINIIEGMELQRAFNENAAITAGSMNESGRLSTIGRINYWYAGRYIMEATFRYEGSVRFSPEERWGFFPAIAAGWVASEENFFRNNIRFIDYLKLRGSAGRLGNDHVGGWQWQYSYGIAGNYLFGNRMVSGLEPQNNGVAMTGVTWEKTNSYNGGLDMRFLDSRLSLSLDAWYKYTWDILVNRGSVLPTTSGLDKMPKENYGRMKAWGYDMQIGYKGRISENVFWYITANFDFATNRILEKPQSSGVLGTWKDEIGKPSGGFETGYVVNGIISTQAQLDVILAENPGFTIFGAAPELGMLNFQDIGRAGIISAGEPAYVFEPDGRIDDYDLLHIVVPPMHLQWKHLLPTSFSLGVSWKGLMVDARFTAAWGVEQAIVDKPAREAATSTQNVPAFWRDYWTPENPGAAYPSPAWSDDNRASSTFWVRDVKELRLRVLRISYQLPQSLSERWKIPEIRVFFTGDHLWNPISTFDYKEDAIAKFNSYPLMKTFNFGLNLNI